MNNTSLQIFTREAELLIKNASQKERDNFQRYKNEILQLAETDEESAFAAMQNIYNDLWEKYGH